ncbi:MAG: O-antigen ligase family protein [Chloroflexi bacterium]|nr:O-antigen ligase family protein [Chloroflexota bacterium]
MMLLSIAVTGLLGLRIGAAAFEFLALTGWSVFPPLGLRIDSRPWGHPYDVALLGVMLYPSWFLRRPSRVRVGAAAIVGCLLTASVILMGSRAVWAASVGGLFVWILPLIAGRWRTWRRRAVAIGIGSAALLGGVVLVAAPSFLDRVLDIATLGQRGQMWLAGINAWLTRPIAGFGPGSFPWVLQQTDYFDTNTLAPRHPDSSVFQLLPEVGLLGLLAAGVILVALTPRLWRRRSSGARFALGAFVVASLGSNPTDFPYLVVVAVLWAAIASPRVNATRRASGRRARAISIASYACLAVIGLAVACASLASVYYDLAGRFAGSGQLERAARSLDAAVALDPNMALYWRQRGTVQLLQGEPEVALSDLRAATDINPSDDLAWRTLALALKDAGRVDEAHAALGKAVAVQRSDPTNLLVLAAWTASSAPADALLAELVQAWPPLLSAQAWASVASGPSVTTRVANLALRRWETGAASLEPPTTQGEWLTLLASPGDLLSEVAAMPGDPTLTEASLRLSLCGERAASALRSLPRAYQRFGEYWALVVQLAAEGGAFDERAARAYSLIAGRPLHADAWKATLNPLHENDTRGYSADQWGYRRLAIQWPEYAFELPSPGAGAVRWILDPAGARRQAQVKPPSEC